MRTEFIDAIKRFEGFTPKAKWDYAQNSNGYGTRALYAGEVIDKVEAERRFNAEIADARALVARFAPNLDEGTAAALTSLTFNAGTRWMGSGLGAAVKAGDLEAAKQAFVQYVNAGGQRLAGLESRRAAEVQWFGQGQCLSHDQLEAARSTPKTATVLDVGSIAGAGAKSSLESLPISRQSPSALECAEHQMHEFFLDAIRAVLRWGGVSPEKGESENDLRRSAMTGGTGA